MAGALISYGIGRKNKTVRDYFADFVVVSEFAVMLAAAYFYLTDSSMSFAVSIPGICGMGISATLDGFRVVYGLVSSFLWMMTLLFSKDYFKHYRNRNRYYFFNLMTLGATMGVFLSADLFTTFIFFEIMSFTSYAWVAHDEKKDSLRAAETYLAVAVIGGLVTLMGLFLLYDQVGTLDMSLLLEACKACPNTRMLYVAGACVFVGFAAKAGAFPLHIWLPKAHPVAPAPASALLSGILTKSGVFGILVVSCNIFFHDTAWGNFILAIGTLTMFGGALLAVFSVDLKRTLACSSMSQIGFILVAIGMQCLLGEENVLAAAGTLLHMVNHSLIKLVLFMAAGVVFMNLHKLNLNDIRGFGRNKPLLNFAFLMGALGIGGIPLWNGYVSKTLIHESILEYASSGVMQAVEYIFLFSGGLTIAYMLKLYIVLFIEKNKDPQIQAQFDAMKGKYMSKLTALVLTVSAVILPIMGFLPNLIMEGIAKLGMAFMHVEEEMHAVSYFSFANLQGALISIAIGLLVYFLIVRTWLRNREGEYLNRWPAWWDLENGIYRPILTKLLPNILGFFSRILDSLVDWFVVLVRKSLLKDQALAHELPEGNIVTYLAGSVVNGGVSVLNKTFYRKKPIQINFVHKFAMWSEGLKESNMIIYRSLSFGLLMFAAGLVLTLIYLLFW